MIAVMLCLAFAPVPFPKPAPIQPYPIGVWDARCGSWSGEMVFKADGTYEMTSRPYAGIRPWGDRVDRSVGKWQHRYERLWVYTHTLHSWDGTSRPEEFAFTLEWGEAGGKVIGGDWHKKTLIMRRRP